MLQPFGILRKQLTSLFEVKEVTVFVRSINHVHLKLEISLIGGVWSLATIIHVRGEFWLCLAGASRANM